MKPIFPIFSGIAIFPFTIYSIVGSLTADLQNGITQFFSLFGQFIAYLIDAPTTAWAQITEDFGYSFASYGVMIPIMLVVVLAITAMVVIIILQISKTVEEGGNVENLMGGME
ncbi:MAG: hypothetical protein QXV17_14035 [Candidatus Micrarchaeaceae archaeon]